MLDVQIDRSALHIDIITIESTYVMQHDLILNSIWPCEL